MLILYALLLSSLQTSFAAEQIAFKTPSPLRIPSSSPPLSSTHSLTLVHALHLSHSHKPILHRRYSTQELSVLSSDEGHSNTQEIRTTREKVWRPSSNEAFQAQRRANYYHKRSARTGKALSIEERVDSEWGRELEWREEEIEVPDITDVETIAALAKMTSNAYASPDRPGDWYAFDGKWNVSDSFGWLEDGIRGHVFADDTNSTVVVAIKGTSATFIGGGTTSRNDKFNDNLLFSCCCARVDWTWSTVCDCYGGGYICGQDCIEDAVMNESAYYTVATDLMNNITALYPHAQIWLSGHSLGGSLASMLSLTYGIPSVSYESLGDVLPASRLHLPLPPGLDYSHSKITTHVYHTADPIPQGVCTGALSTCAVAGFALETKCHSGRSIIYDSVGRLGWSVDIRTHTIKGIIENLLIEEWSVPKKSKVKVGGWGWWPGKKPPEDDPDFPEPDDGQRGGKGVPEARAETECQDCFRWEFV